MKSDILVPDEAESVQDLSDQDTSLSALDLLLLFAQNRRFILIFTGVAAVLTIIITLILPFEYTAETSVLPPQQNSISSSIFAQLSGLSSLASLGGGLGGGFSLKNPSDLYVAMFQSRVVEDAMVKRFDLVHRYKKKRVSDARKSFERHAKAVAGTKDGIIRITMEASSPQLASDMANAYVDEFRKLEAGLAVTEASQRRLFFDNQLIEAKNALADAEEDLKKTEITTGMVQPDSQSRALIDSAARIQGQIAATQVQLRAMGSFATEDNPEVVLLKQQLAGLETQLQRLTGSSASDSDLFVPKGKIPQVGLDYVRKLREVKYREVIFEAIARQFELAKLDEARQGAVVQVVDPAIPPDKRSFPKRGLIVLAMTFVAFFLACAIVFLKGKLDEDKETHRKVMELRSMLIWRRS